MKYSDHILQKYIDLIASKAGGTKTSFQGEPLRVPSVDLPCLYIAKRQTGAAHDTNTEDRHEIALTSTVITDVRSDLSSEQSVDGLIAGVNEHPQLTANIVTTIAVVGGLALAISALSAVIGGAITVFLALEPIIVAVGVVMTALGGPIIALGILLGVFAAVVLTRWSDLKLGTQVVWEAITGVIRTAVQTIINLVPGLWNTVSSIASNVRCPQLNRRYIGCVPAEG